MELSNLRIFVAVLDTASVTSAADVVGLTPGAVSQQLRSLSKHLGAELFMLLAANGQLAILDADLEILEPETRNGESDAQYLSLPQQLDIIGRIPFPRPRAAGGGALRRKREPEIAFEKCHARHRAKALSEAAPPVAFSRP